MVAIITKYHPATNTRGSRVSASANGLRVSVPFYLDGDACPHKVAAKALCNKLGWTGELIEGKTLTGNVYVFTEGDKIKI